MKKSGFAKGVIWTLSIGIVLVVILATVGIVAYNSYKEASLKASYSTGKSKTTINIEKKDKNSETAEVTDTESAQTIEKETIPEWFIKLPQGSDKLLYVRGTAVSDQLQLALDLATNAALRELGKKVETRLASKSKETIRQAGMGEDQVSKTEINLISSTVVDEVTVSGFEAVETKMVSLDNGSYRAFILLEYPVVKAYKTYMEKIEESPELKGRLTEIKNTDIYKELQKAVAASSGT